MYKLQPKLFSITRFIARNELRGEDIDFYSYREFGQYLANQFECNKNIPSYLRFCNMIPLEIVQAPRIGGVTTDGYIDILKDILDVHLNYEYTYFVYSSVNHDLANPHLILLLPFDRDIKQEEYNIVFNNLIKFLDLRLVNIFSLPSIIGVEDQLGVNNDCCDYKHFILAPITPSFVEYKPIIISEVRGKVLSVDNFLTPITDGLKRVN